MMDAKSLDFLLHIMQSPHPQYALVFDTPYGLHVAVDKGAITVRLSDDTALSETECQLPSSHYRIQPVREDLCVVTYMKAEAGVVKEWNAPVGDLAATFSTTWCRAMHEWAQKATAFSASDGLLFERTGVRWVLEGALLASWLVLQRHVQQVKYVLPQGLPNAVLDKSNVGDSLTSLAREINVQSAS